KGLDDVLKKTGTPYVINHLGSMISIHFSNKPVTDFASASSANNALFNQFFHAMLDRGVYLPPSAFETWFLSHALSKEDLDETIAATAASLSDLLGG
ncbi:MAG TPA: aspartate aminotransferase family protein, partial [Flavisolibacter sp.]